MPDASKTTVWRQRGYRLTIFGPDDHLVTCVDLTDEQADEIGKAFFPDDADGVGEYPIETGYVYLSPTNGE